jgi:tripartite-type tricarboxylate transporter receptor subunit TctC
MRSCVVPVTSRTSLGEKDKRRKFVSGGRSNASAPLRGSELSMWNNGSKGITVKLRTLIAAALASLLLGSAGHSQESFYKGRTLTLVVGYSVGGGYDQYARLLARHLGRHVLGNPNVIVQNMPGAASLTAVRYLDTTAPKDGTVITTFDPGLITESFAAPDVYKIRFLDFRWVGALLRDIRICYAWSATGIRNWDDMMKRREFLIGTTAKGSNAYVNGATLRKVFNAPVRQIAGYPGSNEQRLALERGELEGNCGSWSAIPQDWITNARINPLVRFTAKRPADMAESVPYVVDLASTQEQKALLTILNASAELGRPFIVAKQIPSERLMMLRAALAETLQDKAFLEEAQKQNLPLDPLNGDDAEKILAEIYAAPGDLARRVKDVIE